MLCALLMQHVRLIEAQKGRMWKRRQNGNVERAIGTPPLRSLLVSDREIPDIGTKIIYKTCFVHNSTQIEALVTYSTPFESSRRALYAVSVNTRFKEFWDFFFRTCACDLGFAGTRFLGLLPWRATKFAHQESSLDGRIACQVSFQF